MLRLVLWRRASVSRLPQAQAATLLAAAEVFRARWLDGSGERLGPALVPQLPGYPRTVAATELLTAAIAKRA